MLFQDWTNCMYCDKSCLLNELHHVVVFDGDEPKTGESKRGKPIVLCPECYNRMKQDPEFDKEIEKHFVNSKTGVWRMFKHK